MNRNQPSPGNRENPLRDRLLTVLSVSVLVGLLWYADNYTNAYTVRILTTSAIFIILAVSYNIINGVTGQFSLGPHAFLAVGAYTSAILTLTHEEKVRSFIIEPMMWPFSQITLSFPLSLLIAGTVTAITALLVAIPVFRTRGDYLAIATFGFGEVIQVLTNNFVPLTNGPLGLKGLHPHTNLWWSWGVCILSIVCIMKLVGSSYGRAMKAVREDETAAEAMGINAFRTKTLAFAISAFFTGIAGGLLAHLITTISPSLFTFFLTFNLLIIIVTGGLGSTTGSVIAALLFTFGGEFLRITEEPFTLFGYEYPGIAGMRMVIFSAILILVMLFAQEGIMGRSEFSWSGLFSRTARWFGRDRRRV
ncbi:MAG: branched-chain amino acid ABC transporter permease [Pseudomonadota bacterium]